MNNDVIKKMKKAQASQTRKIKALDCYDEVSKEFSLEYDLAKELHDARVSAKLTQAEIARRMGTTQSVVSRIEHGTNVSVDTLARYARACGKNLEVHLT